MTDSFVASNDSNRTGKAYKFRIYYEYAVDKRLFHASLVTLDIKKGDRSRARTLDMVCKYPEGKAVTVYYLPFLPSIAILEPPNILGNTPWMFLSVIVPYILLGFFAYVWKKEQHEQALKSR